MAVTIIRDPLSGREFAAAAGHRMYLYGESGKISLSVPVAPRDITYGGLGQDWVTAERSGDRPLLLRKGIKLETLAFSVLMTDKIDTFAPQTGVFNAVRVLAETTERILVRYGPQETGLWRVTDCTMTSSLRHPDTNEIVRGVLSLTLTRASDAAPSVGPVTGGAAAPPGAPTAPAPQRTHRVVSGNTLWGIAQQYYGNGALWPRIFDANRDRIRDPHWIYPGQEFVIP
ncbi:MAG: LysM peptidoglycan-binding domain-containing protein [Saccharothrix sp.]|nr:LysM peptidoglycan-binding domain-containing protein [Saccharothrix sp.]